MQFTFISKFKHWPLRAKMVQLFQPRKHCYSIQTNKNNFFQTEKRSSRYQLNFYLFSFQCNNHFYSIQKKHWLPQRLFFNVGTPQGYFYFLIHFFLRFTHGTLYRLLDWLNKPFHTFFLNPPWNPLWQMSLLLFS